MKLDALRDALDRIAAGAAPGSLENEQLDFKQDPATVTAGVPAAGNADAKRVEMLVEAVLCFANAGGGLVVLGVADKASGADAFTGTAADVSYLRKKIFDNTRPGLPVQITEHMHDGARLLVIEVPEGLDLYTDRRGRAVSRRGTSCVVLTEEERRDLSFTRRNPDLTARRSARSVGDITQSSMRELRRLLSNTLDRRSELAQVGDDALLRSLGLVADDGGLLIVGELLLCEPPHDLADYLVRDAAGSEPRVERFSGPLILVLPSIQERVTQNIRPELAHLALGGGQEVSIPDFPPVALDEALTNAFVHRDWAVADKVVIDHSPQVLRVWSPGSLPVGVEHDRLLSTVSRPRNTALMSVLRTLGLAEASSRGFDRMYREMIRTGRSAPAVVVDDFSVDVVFTSGSPNKAFAGYVATLRKDLRENVNVLLVLSRLCSRATIDLRTAASLMQISPDEATRVLEWMSTAEVAQIQLVPKSAPTWRLSPGAQAGLGTAVRYRARADDAREQVVNHLAEYGWITNKTVRNMFALDVQQARALLAELAAHQVIVKDPEGADRGPGIKWLPGPAVR